MVSDSPGYSKTNFPFFCASVFIHVHILVSINRWCYLGLDKIDRFDEKQILKTKKKSSLKTFLSLTHTQMMRWKYQKKTQLFKAAYHYWVKIVWKPKKKRWNHKMTFQWKLNLRILWHSVNFLVKYNLKIKVMYRNRLVKQMTEKWRKKENFSRNEISISII